MKITPKETNVAAVFSSSFLVIPRFQRPYSWDKDNIQDFWEDIFASKPNDYFFGSMVMFRSSESATEAFVVDGQQRLTTVTVFLCVLRDALIRLSENALAKGIQQIIERRDINNKLTFTLISQDPYPFFQDHIQKMGKRELSGPIGDEEAALKDCYDDLTAKVSDHVQGKKKQIQIKELQKLRDRALAIKVITIDLDNEFRVAHRVLDISVAEVSLQGSGIVPLVGEGVAAGMAQHVRMGLEARWNMWADPSVLKGAGALR